MERLKETSFRAIVFAAISFLISFSNYAKGTYIKNFISFFIVYLITYPLLEITWKLLKNKNI